MALNDCWCWLDAIFEPETPEQKQRREHEEKVKNNSWWSGFITATLIWLLVIVIYWCHN
jgi:hypothetical protein